MEKESFPPSLSHFFIISGALTKDSLEGASLLCSHSLSLAPHQEEEPCQKFKPEPPPHLFFLFISSSHLYQSAPSTLALMRSSRRFARSLALLFHLLCGGGSNSPVSSLWLFQGWKKKKRYLEGRARGIRRCI